MLPYIHLTSRITRRRWFSDHDLYTTQIQRQRVCLHPSLAAAASSPPVHNEPELQQHTTNVRTRKYLATYLPVPKNTFRNPDSQMAGESGRLGQRLKMDLPIGFASRQGSVRLKPKPCARWSRSFRPERILLLNLKLHGRPLTPTQCL